MENTGLEDKQILPLEITKIENNKPIDLLYLKEDSKEHYCWIKDLWKLVRIFLCKTYFNSFQTQDKFKKTKYYYSYQKAVKKI